MRTTQCQIWVQRWRRPLRLQQPQRTDRSLLPRSSASFPSMCGVQNCFVIRRTRFLCRQGRPILVASCSNGLKGRPADSVRPQQAEAVAQPQLAGSEARAAAESASTLAANASTDNAALDRQDAIRELLVGCPVSQLCRTNSHICGEHPAMSCCWGLSAAEHSQPFGKRKGCPDVRMHAAAAQRLAAKAAVRDHNRLHPLTGAQGAGGPLRPHRQLPCRRGAGAVPAHDCLR